MEICRDVVDAGISLKVRVPRKWLEYPSAQALLAVGGDLGQPEGSLQPTAIWSVAEAKSGAEATFAAIKQDLLSLPEVSLVTETAGWDEFPHYSVLAVFRNGDTGVAQTAVLHAQYVAGQAAGVPMVVNAQGNCGGGASVEVVKALSEVVRSTTVTLGTAGT